MFTKQDIDSFLNNSNKEGTIEIKKENTAENDLNPNLMTEISNFGSSSSSETPRIKVEADCNTVQSEFIFINETIKSELSPNENCRNIIVGDFKNVNDENFENINDETFENINDETFENINDENLEVSIDEIKALNKPNLEENETTVYKCPMCEQIFKKLQEYKEHKKKHFIEKRRCNICNRVLQSIGKLAEHMNKHLGLRPFTCDECDKSFISVHHLKLHKKCHTTEKNYKCTECDKAFRTKSSLRSHLIVHNQRTEEYRCKVCSVDCKDQVTYRSHMTEHGKKSEIQCGLCNKAFNTDRGLEAHLSSHKELKFPCEYCGKIYSSMYRIKRHIKRAHAPNKCGQCNEVFYDRILFSKHKRQHEEEKKQFECPHCQKIFEKAKNLSEHIRLQHKQDGEMKKCPICGKEFINNALLKNHVKTHDKSFQCNFCKKVFSSRSNLETHSVVHSGAKNYKCHICNKSLSSKTSLKNHCATHSEERQFECDSCDKKFKTSRRLYVHKLCHETEEKYQCEICLQKFRVKQYVKFHMQKHSNVKRFECEVCKKRFKHKKSRDKHMKIGKHKLITDTEHECDFCDESFVSRDLLLDHFAEVHHKENVINSINDCQDGDTERMNTEENIKMSGMPLGVTIEEKKEADEIQIKIE